MTSYWTDLVDRRMATGRWLIAVEFAAAATVWVRLLKECGAERPFVLAAWNGGGKLPAPEDAEVFLLDLPPQNDFMDGIKLYEAALERLPANAVHAIRSWDPEGRARVLGPFFARANPIDGRTYLGGRPANWQALEDKTIIDAIWDLVGVARAPYTIVPPTLDALTLAATQMDMGRGTVQAADSRDGFHGGASRTRWVQTPGHQRDAQELFAPICDKVRVMPFLEGIPCSIHGMVFPDVTVAFRPMEMVVLRRPQKSEFLYARAASFWDPPGEYREQMRSMARRMGEYLRATYGFRGAFTIDGVMTAGGFRPTELNPRFGAALAVMTSSVSFASHLTFLNYLLIEGESLEWRAEALEEEILNIGDVHRNARVGFLHSLSVLPTTSQKLLLAPSNTGWQEVPEDVAVAEVHLDPTEKGVFINISFSPERTPIGNSVAPWTAQICAWLDTHYNLEIGCLFPATDFHARS